MPLSPGEQLGPYRVVGAIGAGGMGEVYRATDTRLQRSVALKVSELLVGTLPTPGARPVVAWHGGALSPRWSTDGRELFFIANKKMMSARVVPGSGLSLAPAVEHFGVESSTSFDIDPRTGRFLMMVPTSAPPPTITITLNWPRR